MAAAYAYSVFVNCPFDAESGGTAIAKRYELFRQELPAMCDRLRLNVAELTFSDYVLQVEEWLKLNLEVAE